MITLKDKLSHLTYRQACRYLGAEGERLIRQGGRFEIDIAAQVAMSNDLFRLQVDGAEVEIALTPERKDRLRYRCRSCGEVCVHVAAAFSLILEEKMALGLAAPPPERIPIESLSEEELVGKAIKERSERAAKEIMDVRPVDEAELWTDYLVTSRATGKTYRVALRGWERGESYCTCPDFRKNTLGTCKHILHVISRAQARFGPEHAAVPYRPREIAVYLSYGEKLELRVLVPEDLPPSLQGLVAPIAGRPVGDIHDLLNRIRELDARACDVRIYPDAEEYIQQTLYRQRVDQRIGEIRKDPAHHPLRTTLLKIPLLPYQLDGIAFAAGRGRAILADDMGLGKTIQGIGMAELLARDTDISRVLVICPASLKTQWRLEIERATDRTCRLVLGSAAERASQYGEPAFFTICNYEQVLRDFKLIERISWDLIILDEGQRIKNWEAKTSRIIKSLRSPFALVLSGTPLENRLEELFTVAGFIDERRLGPAFRFFNRYRVTDERGRVLGYKNLDELRERLKPMLLRRRRRDVLQELPSRTTEILRIPPTDEQLELHNAHRQLISLILRKRYLTEMDILRLQKALLACRMAANSTFLVDKQPPGHSSKLAELEGLIDQLFAEEERKAVLFSEWTTMLNLIEPILKARGLEYVRLDGSVPQKQRQQLVHRFQKEEDCRLFLTTNAGATGLNLQAADTILNVDLPWNPAILEQRISRAHRMGQKRPVQVFLLVTEGTLEESLLNTLSAKHELALAVLDPDSQLTAVNLASGMEELKNRLELLLGIKPPAPVDESAREEAERQAGELRRRERIAAAGGQLLGAAFAFLGEIFPGKEETPESLRMADAFREQLFQCLEKGADGSLRMTVTLPDETALNNLARSLARIAAGGR
ncbi:MAG TPA: DEAD/DEAH box helicase [Syntrophales bacterium]|nr:DEAD/DEAH box helicase [Syntrophales bacterium]